MKKRLLSLLLVLVMVMSLLPVTAMAGGENTISEVEVWGLDVPVVGEEPDYEGVLIGNPNYTITAPENSSVFTNGIQWYDMTADCTMQENDVFQADHEYQLTVSLKANDGYSFDTVENVRASVNLHETACALSFYGIDASQYITVTLGTASDFVYLTPLHRSSVTVTNGVAYNENGEVITEALEGDTITVEGVPPVPYYAFKGWTVESSETLEGFDATSYQASFTMPASDVVIAGNFEDDEDFYALINYAFVNLDQCVAGEEADFTPSNAVGETVYSGYHFVAPNRHDASKFYNGVCWRNTTNNTFLAPGDVFEEGNEYCVYVCIATDNGFLFSEDLTTSLNYVGECDNYEDNDVESSKGRIIQSNPIKPATRYNISITNGQAYNDDGEVITEALPGQTVTVKGVTPTGSPQVFEGWTVETPKELEDLWVLNEEMMFTMPASDVVIVGDYGDIVITSICVDLDECKAGCEADFTPTIIAEENEDPGYTFVDPAVLADEWSHNGVSWWDSTTTTFLEPGDVFVEGHTYYGYVGLVASDGYVFSEEMTTTVSHLGECGNYDDGNIDPIKRRVIQMEPPTPWNPKAINLMGGTAYDKDGNVITEAMPYTLVTLVADEPDFGWKFDCWTAMGEGVLDIDDPYAATTTFIMPEQDITIFAGYTEAEKVPVQSLTFTLKGYYINANAGCLQVGVSEGAQFVQNSVSGLDYIVLANNADKPTTTQVTGALRNTAKHWIGVTVDAAFGYTLESLTADKVTAPFAEQILFTTNGDGTIGILMLVTNPGRPLIKKTITVTDGSAFINSTAVTSTVPGMKVTVQSIEAPDGKFFAGWKVISGNVVLEDPMNPITSFTMGSSNVELEATFQDYISYVEVNILEPQAGMTPSYLAKFTSYDCGYTYEDYNVEGSFRRGVAWRDLDTEEYLDPATAVFERGHSYRVYIMLTTQDNQAFYLDEYGYPAVTGCVNGMTDGVYVEQYHEDSSHHVMLTTSFYIEEDAELAEPVTQVTLTELEAPVAGKLFGYYCFADFMEHISVTSSYDNEATTFNGITWIDVTDPANPVTMVPMTSVAQAGHTYRAEILVQPINNYIFAVGENSINATVNGQPCETTAVAGLPATHLVKVIFQQYCIEPISDVAVYDVDTPAPSYGFDYYAVVEEGVDYALDYSYAEEYFLNGIRWTNLTEDPDVHMQPELGVAGSGYEYRVSIIVKAADGCAFRVDENGMPDLNATVNGMPCEVSAVGDLDASQYVMLTYDVTSYKLHSISVLDGGLAVCPTDVTDAKTDAYTTEQIMLIPANKESEGLEFSHWEVVEGQMGDWDMTNANLVFEMPDCDMVFRAVYKSATAELIKWVGTQLQATSNLDMQFALRVADLNGTTGNYIVLTRTYANGRADDVVTIPQENWTKSDSFYIVAYSGLAAKEMGDAVSAVVYNAKGQVISETRTESIESYALSMLGKITNAEQKTMFVDLLNYGAEAQKYFHYNESHLVNAGLTATQKSWATQEDIEVTDQRVKGENFFGSQLSLENVILLQMAFKVTPAEGMYAIASFTNHNGKKVEEKLAVTDNNGYAMISVNSLAIADYRTDVTVTLYNADGSVAGSATDSMASYVARSKTDLGKAIMKFGASAYAYFH